MYISNGTWRDLTDGHLYHEGDIFPFDGREIKKERLDELGSAHNRAGFALIRACEVQDEPKAARKEKAPEKAAEAPETKPKAKARKTTVKK